MLKARGRQNTTTTVMPNIYSPKNPANITSPPRIAKRQAVAHVVENQPLPRTPHRDAVVRFAEGQVTPAR